MKATSTEGNAAVFIGAAKLIEDEVKALHCWGNINLSPDIAIAIQATREQGYDFYLKEREQFRRVFGEFPQGFIEHGSKVLALCFMAAMVEAGDA